MRAGVGWGARYLCCPAQQRSMTLTEAMENRRRNGPSNNNRSYCVIIRADMDGVLTICQARYSEI